MNRSPSLFRKIVPVSAVVATLAGFALLRAPSAAQTSDQVILTFATVGDSREDPTTPNISAQDKLWLQNTRVLTRQAREISAQKASVLFYNGDMIMGYTTDTNTLNRQYAFWRGVVAGLMETGTYVVPVPGNHEVQEKGKDAAGKDFKLARLGNENAWRENMGDLILNQNLWKTIHGEMPAAWDINNAPIIGGPDGIQTDQKQLSYSFDAKGLHFVVINTDPVGNDAHAPANWLAADLAAAKARGVKNIFVFGHKPLATYKYNDKVAAGGVDVNADNASAVWDVIEKYNATYFCGHEHIYHAMQPAKDKGGKAWEVIVGSGGSPFDAKPGDSQNPNDRKYAWVKVSVYASGKVHADAYAFDENMGSTSAIESWDLQ